jgi:rubrerythrin
MNTAMRMEDEILELYAGLCREAARCELHSLRAIKDGRPELAPLFKSLGMSLNMQAKRFMLQIRGTITTIDDSIKEVYNQILPGSASEYERLANQAELIGNKALETGFSHSAKIQRKNSSLYRQVASDQQVSKYHVCDFCGYVARNKAPEQCPICTAPKKRFLTVAP